MMSTEALDVAKTRQLKSFKERKVGTLFSLILSTDFKPLCGGASGSEILKLSLDDNNQAETRSPLSAEFFDESALVHRLRRLDI